MEARQPITDERKQVYLEVLARTGSLCGAAAAATPHGSGRKAGVSSFRDLARRDAQFAWDVQEARNDALGRVENAIAQRAIDGVQRPIFQKGVLAGFETVYSDHLLLKLAQRLDPDSWTDRRKVEFSGQVQHAHVMLSITASDVLCLPEADQETFVNLLQKIGKSKNDGLEDQKLLETSE